MREDNKHFKYDSEEESGSGDSLDSDEEDEIQHDDYLNADPSLLAGS